MTTPVHIQLGRNGRTFQTGLESIRTALHGNTLAIEYIGRFLQYSNIVLNAAERHCRTPRDQARAEVSYGNRVFLFTRMN